MTRKTKIAVKHTKLSDRQLCKLVEKKDGVVEARMIAPADIETAEWVRLKCQFGCDGYGQCLVCPPFTPTPEQMRKVIDCYKRAVLIHFEPDADAKEIVADLERKIFLLGCWKALGLGAGSCYLCKECDVDQKQCCYPERARPSIEACGIDVFTTVKKAGLPIEVVRTKRQCPNYYGLILID